MKSSIFILLFAIFFQGKPTLAQIPTQLSRAAPELRALYSQALQDRDAVNALMRAEGSKTDQYDACKVARLTYRREYDDFFIDHILDFVKADQQILDELEHVREKIGEAEKEAGTPFSALLALFHQAPTEAEAYDTMERRKQQASDFSTHLAQVSGDSYSFERGNGDDLAIRLRMNFQDTHFLIRLSLLYDWMDLSKIPDFSHRMQMIPWRDFEMINNQSMDGLYRYLAGYDNRVPGHCRDSEVDQFYYLLIGNHNHPIYIPTQEIASLIHSVVGSSPFSTSLPAKLPDPHYILKKSDDCGEAMLGLTIYDHFYCVDRKPDFYQIAGEPFAFVYAEEEIKIFSLRSRKEWDLSAAALIGIKPIADDIVGTFLTNDGFLATSLLNKYQYPKQNYLPLPFQKISLPHEFVKSEDGFTLQVLGGKYPAQERAAQFFTFGADPWAVYVNSDGYTQWTNLKTHLSIKGQRMNSIQNVILKDGIPRAVGLDDLNRKDEVPLYQIGDRP